LDHRVLSLGVNGCLMQRSRREFPVGVIGSNR
jgi:hypothetical protein